MRRPSLACHCWEEGKSAFLCSGFSASLTASPLVVFIRRLRLVHTGPLKSSQRAALDRFSEACLACGFSIPTAVRKKVDWPLDGRDDLTEEKMKVTPKMKCRGCYTQWARLLPVFPKKSLTARMAGSFQQCFSIALCLTLSYAVSGRRNVDLFQSTPILLRYFVWHVSFYQAKEPTSLPLQQ